MIEWLRGHGVDDVVMSMGYLATADCPIAGKVFFVWANEVRLFQPWTIVDTVCGSIGMTGRKRHSNGLGRRSRSGTGRMRSRWTASHAVPRS